MNSDTKISTADIADRHRRLMAAAVLALSLKFTVSAVMHIVGSGAGRYLDALEAGLALLAVALIIPVLLWKLRKLPKEERHLYFSPDGYVAVTLSRAHIASWGATFLLLIGLDIVSRDFFPNLPPAFFLQVVMAVMLGVFSAVFFVLNREDKEPELESVSGA